VDTPSIQREKRIYSYRPKVKLSNSIDKSQRPTQ